MLTDIGGNKNENNGGDTDYYRLPESVKKDNAMIQDLIEHKKMNFAVGNIFKAAYRLDSDDHDTIRDLHKIIWFANREIDRIEKEE